MTRHLTPQELFDELEGFFDRIRHRMEREKLAALDSVFVALKAQRDKEAASHDGATPKEKGRD